METVVFIIMLAVLLAFTLKLSCHSLTGAVALSALVALSVWFARDYAVTQSKSIIADWLANPVMMLDAAVILTMDVALTIAFSFSRMRSSNSHVPMYVPAWRKKIRKGALLFIHWFPGLLILPVAIAVLVECIFSMPGADFTTVTLCTATAFLIGTPLSALLLKLLLPSQESRMELTFLIALLTAALGIVATVNGRTAAAGTATVEFIPLLSVIALLIAGTFAGFIIYRLKQQK